VFGKRAAGPVLQEPRPIPVAQTAPKLAPVPAPAKPPPSAEAAAPAAAANRAPKASAASKMRPMASAAPVQPVTTEATDQQEFYQATKAAIFNALINTIDLSQLAQLDAKGAAEEMRDIVAELIALKNVSISVAEQERLVQDIIHDGLVGAEDHRQFDGGKVNPFVVEDAEFFQVLIGQNRGFEFNLVGRAGSFVHS